MSPPLRGEGALARALPSGEAAPPGMEAGGAQGLGQLGEGGERRAGAILAKGGIAAPRLGRAPGGAEALWALGRWVGPGLEHEVGPGGLELGEDPAGVQDDQAAVEAFAELDAAAGLRAAAGAGGELQPARAEPHGIVARHGPGI